MDMVTGVVMVGEEDIGVEDSEVEAAVSGVGVAGELLACGSTVILARRCMGRIPSGRCNCSV